jgi:hypothetical protein
VATSTVCTPDIQIQQHKVHTDLAIPLLNTTNNSQLLGTSRKPKKGKAKQNTDLHQCRCSFFRQTPIPDDAQGYPQPGQAGRQVRQAGSSSESVKKAEKGGEME